MKKDNDEDGLKNGSSNFDANAVLFNNSPHMSILFDSNSQIIECSTEAMNCFGYSSKSDFCNEFTDILYKCASPTRADGFGKGVFKERLSSAYKSGFEEFFIELVLVGIVRHIHVILKRVPFDDSYAVAAYLTECRESGRHLKSVMEYSPAACVILDGQTHTVRDCSEEAVQFFGFPNKEDYIDNQRDTLPDGDARAVFHRYIKQAKETGRVVFEFTFKSKSGEPLFAEATAIKIRWRGSDAFLVYAYDLRELKAAEKDARRHADLLAAVNSVAKKLLASGPNTFEDEISNALRIIGTAVDADRTYIWENFEKEGKHYCRQVYEFSEGAEPQQGKSFTDSFCYDDVPNWKEKLFANKTINGPVRNLPSNGEREVLEMQGIKSVLVLPININGQLWGFIGFDDCLSERTFSKVEEHVLQSGGILIVSSILRNLTTIHMINQGEELQKNERLLRAVNYVAACLLETEHSDFADTAQKALMTLGNSVDAKSVAVWRNFRNEQGELLAERLFGWNRNKIPDEDSERLVLDYENHLPRWQYEREDIDMPISGMSEKIRSLAVLEGSELLLLLPIHIHGGFWGFIGFSRSNKNHHFNNSEKNILRSGGLLIASAVIREEINESLIDAREKAFASARSKSEFLSRMSHEIRTPLNAIIGMVDLARKNEDINMVRHYLNNVASSSRQLLDIINDVLDMSKIDANKLEIINKEFDFEKLLRHTFNVVEVKIKEKKLNFELDFPKAFSRYVISDELRLSQVLLNLLSNAVKFTTENGLIKLKVRETPIDDDHSTIHLEVIDNGIGIDSEQLSNIFNSFEQGDGGITRKYGGTGLGLAICQRIINIMGGEIWVESESGQGSTFVVELDVGWGSEISGSIETQSIRRDLRVLVVDDAPEVLVYFKSVLMNYSVECDTASNGYGAIGMVSANLKAGKPYDVVFLDWFMPNMNGGEVAREIMRIMRNDVIIIIISSANWIDIKSEAEAANVKYFLPKPVFSSNLYNMLIEVIGGAKTKVVDELKLEPGAYDWTGKTILLVDDNEINREIVTGLLEETGLTIDEAVNGREAVEMFASNAGQYSLILMDVQMPVLDGLSAAKEIRAMETPEGKNIPIYAMTANAFKEDELASYEAGMNGHIAKPFDIYEILDVLRKFLS